MNTSLHLKKITVSTHDYAITNFIINNLSYFIHYIQVFWIDLSNNWLTN